MPPLQIFAACTSRAAAACGLEKDRGTVASDKIADLPVARGDLPIDYQVLEEVVLAGDQAGLRAKKTTLD